MVVLWHYAYILFFTYDDVNVVLSTSEMMKCLMRSGKFDIVLEKSSWLITFLYLL